MLIVDKLPIRSLSESNVFLRSLWAILRLRFRRLGWQYTPHRFGSEKRIRLGRMTLGASPPDGVEVVVHYGRVGIITAIEFELCGQSGAIEQTLLESVEKATVRMKNPDKLTRCTQLRTFPPVPLGYYRGTSWYCGPLSDGKSEIGITVRAFDDVDADHEFAVRLTALLDALACMTNVTFESLRESTGVAVAPEEEMNLFLGDPDWIDGIPQEGRHLRLTAPQLSFCNDLVDDAVHDRLTRAARVFHKALVLHYQVPECHDVATALFVSSLEAVDPPLSAPSTCSQCGQQAYRITQRLVDLAVGHLGSGVERVFKDHYNRRSKYLHLGRARSSQPMHYQIIPQLDPNGIEGCAMPSCLDRPVNLAEFSSFIIRKEMLRKSDAEPKV